MVVRILRSEMFESVSISSFRSFLVPSPTSMLSRVRLCLPALSLSRTLEVLLSMTLLFLYQVRVGVGTPVTLQTSSSSSPRLVSTLLSLTVRLGGSTLGT